MKYSMPVMFAVVFASTASAADPGALAKAKAIYYRESVEAIDQYLAKEKAAREKLARAYDQAISSAMKKGGEEGLDEATSLKKEKKELMAKQGQIGDFKMDNVSIPDKDEIIKNLSTKTWDWY